MLGRNLQSTITLLLSPPMKPEGAEAESDEVVPSDSSSEDDNVNDDDANESRRPRSVRRLTGFKRKLPADANTGNARQERRYSDSETSYEPGKMERSIEDRHSTVDFDALSATKWGRKSLVQRGKEDHVAALVGAAITNADEGFAQATQSAALQDTPSSWEHERQAWNPLLGVDTPPLPPSFLTYILERMEFHPAFSRELDDTFDTSAIVAIGMLVEEIMTASFLPAAGLHVLRCRELEHRPMEGAFRPLGVQRVRHPVTGEKVVYDSHNVDRNETAWDAWTMPPTEAIMKILEQGIQAEHGISIERNSQQVLSVNAEGKLVSQPLERDQLSIPTGTVAQSYVFDAFATANPELRPIFEVAADSTPAPALLAVRDPHNMATTAKSQESDSIS